jgi:hypothetical protein
MNEKLEAFRKRLRGPKKEKSKLTWQYWIGSPAAWLALATSSATAFYTVAYHSDELSVVASLPTIEKWSSEELAIYSFRDFTFINSGSRPIEVVAFTTMLVQPRAAKERADCSHGQIDVVRADAVQLVVKPYDITRYGSSMRLNDFISMNENERSAFERHFPKSDANKTSSTKELSAVYCLRLTIIGADTRMWFKTVEVDRVNPGEDPLSHVAKPQYLMKRNNFWTTVASDPPGKTKEFEAAFDRYLEWTQAQKPPSLESD